MKFDKDKMVNNLKTKLEENPVETIAVAAMAATAAAKLLSSMTGAANSRSWKKEVDRRDRMSR